MDAESHSRESRPKGRGKLRRLRGPQVRPQRHLGGRLTLRRLRGPQLTGCSVAHSSTNAPVSARTAEWAGIVDFLDLLGTRRGAWPSLACLAGVRNAAVVLVLGCPKRETRRKGMGQDRSEAQSKQSQKRGGDCRPWMRHRKNWQVQHWHWRQCRWNAQRSLFRQRCETKALAPPPPYEEET
jgi:hypothetical protein